MTPRELAPRESEIAVIGLARSGRAVGTLLKKHGYNVYASDIASSPDTGVVAEQLRALGVAVDIGTHDLERIGRSALVVTSPGVPPTAKPLAIAREKGITIASEVEIALNFLIAPCLIATTGTNGKTTTTALIAHLLRGIDRDAVEAGNIGTPLSEIALREHQPKWISLEMSSFQLHDTPSLKPMVGVLTNLSPDHLDRYASVQDYYADKARLFANADGQSVWVVNADDKAVMQMVADAAGHKYTFEPNAIPAVVFTDPEIAWAGLTETQAQAEGKQIKVAKFPWGASGRAITLDRPEGMTKLLIDPQTERVLGVGIVGAGAGELIAEGVLAIEMAALAGDVELTIHPHPTLSETIMEAAEVFYGTSTDVYRPRKA